MDADGETRTLTSRTLEPKSSASTNSATSAKKLISSVNISHPFSGRQGEPKVRLSRHQNP